MLNNFSQVQTIFIYQIFAFYQLVCKQITALYKKSFSIIFLIIFMKQIYYFFWSFIIQLIVVESLDSKLSSNRRLSDSSCPFSAFSSVKCMNKSNESDIFSDSRRINRPRQRSHQSRIINCQVHRVLVNIDTCSYA